MIFLFFGYGTKVKLVGEGAERTCPRCHNTSRWRHVGSYRYLSLFFVRIARRHREELDDCPVRAHTEVRADTRHRHWGRLRPTPYAARRSATPGSSASARRRRWTSVIETIPIGR
jgi:hypothetical protein